MNFDEAIQTIDDKFAEPTDRLKAEYRQIVQGVLGERVSKGRMDNSAAAMAKDALNGWLNRKASQMLYAYGDTLPHAEIDDFESIEPRIREHFLKWMDTYYLEACHQVDYVAGLVKATGLVHLQGDYDAMKRGNLADIKIMAARLKKEAMKSKQGNVTYNFSGANARVNINSKDYSINVANSKFIFDQLREAAAQVDETKLREEILVAADAMEAAVGKPDEYLPRYTKFTSLIANHTSIFANLIPALTQFLMGS